MVPIEISKKRSGDNIMKEILILIVLAAAAGCIAYVLYKKRGDYLHQSSADPDEDQISKKIVTYFDRLSRDRGQYELYGFYKRQFDLGPRGYDKSPSLIIEDRYHPHRHGDAQALNRICGEFQPATSSPWPLVSKSIQVHFVPGRSVPIGTGALYSLEPFASRNR